MFSSKPPPHFFFLLLSEFPKGKAFSLKLKTGITFDGSGGGGGGGFSYLFFTMMVGVDSQ